MASSRLLRRPQTSWRWSFPQNQFSAVLTVEKLCKTKATEAVGIQGIRAGGRMRHICGQAEIEVEVAFYEAETHLVNLPQIPEIDVIVGFDSEFVTLGARPGVLDLNWRRGGELV
jgi:hypothetical protein